MHIPSGATENLQVSNTVMDVVSRLPLWTGLVGAGWMVIAIRLVALRAIFVTNYVGLRTGMMLPNVGREITVWDGWILDCWLVLTGAIEFAVLGLLLRFAIRRFSRRDRPAPSSVPSSPSRY